MGTATASWCQHGVHPRTPWLRFHRGQTPLSNMPAHSSLQQLCCSSPTRAEQTARVILLGRGKGGFKPRTATPELSPKAPAWSHCACDLTSRGRRPGLAHGLGDLWALRKVVFIWDLREDPQRAWHGGGWEKQAWGKTGLFRENSETWWRGGRGGQDLFSDAGRRNSCMAFYLQDQGRGLQGATSHLPSGQSEGRPWLIHGWGRGTEKLNYLTKVTQLGTSMPAWNRP